MARPSFGKTSRRAIGIVAVLSAILWAQSAATASTVADRTGPQAARAVHRGNAYPVSCRETVGRLGACALVSDFFLKLRRGAWREACSMLGKRLRAATGGPRCDSWVALGAPERPIRLLGAASAGSRVRVSLLVPLRELDHFRTLSWTALIGRERGRLRILATVRVAT
jgi:hypothetical protein